MYLPYNVFGLLVIFDMVAVDNLANAALVGAKKVTPSSVGKKEK